MRSLILKVSPESGRSPKSQELRRLAQYLILYLHLEILLRSKHSVVIPTFIRHSTDLTNGCLSGR